MRSRKFVAIALSGRTEIQDERGIPFGEVRGAPGDVGVFAGAARKAYAHGVADAYTGTMRAYHVDKGDGGESGRSWDLVATGAAVERIARLDRGRWWPWQGRRERALQSLVLKAYSAGREDAGAGSGR